MKMTGALAFAAAAACGVSATAQEIPGPPKVLVVSREEIKPGKMTPHAKSAATFVSVANRAGAANYRIGLVPLSGDTNVVVYLEAHPSFAAYEAASTAFDGVVAKDAALKAEMDAVDRQGEMHESVKTGLYRFRPDLSYRPGGMEEVARARYMTIRTTRVRTGHTPEYVEYVKRFVAAREKAGVDAHTAVYQIVSGGDPSTFLTFTIARSLAEWDEVTARMAAEQKAIEEAYGGAEAARQQRMLLAEAVAETSLVTYAMSPEISRPLPQFVAYDAAFWGGKPPDTGKALAAQKPGRKPDSKQ
jgi:hypothetical protein